MEDKRFLVIAPQFLGDGIISVPFFRNLRAANPSARIDVVSKNAGKLILERVPYVDNVYDIKTIERKFIKEQGYSKVYILKRSLSALLLVLGCGIKNKIGFSGQFRKPFSTKSVKYKSGEKSELECFFDVLRADGINVVDDSLEYFATEDAQKSVQKYLVGDKKALIVAKSSSFVKEWSRENFASVISDLKARGYEIYFAGVEAEKTYYEGLEGHNLCGKLSFDELVALIKNMDLVFGIDSGFCQLASAFGVSTLTLYGPSSIKQWGLLGANSTSFSLNLECSPCKKPKKCPRDFACMKNITPNMVIDALSMLK